MVELNQTAILSHKKDLRGMERIWNQAVAEGWMLQQVVSLADGSATLIAGLYKDA